jgi:hypothetical protein
MASHQLRRFDTWLKDIDSEADAAVKLAIRTGGGVFRRRNENEWPMPGPGGPNSPSAGNALSRFGCDRRPTGSRSSARNLVAELFGRRTAGVTGPALALAHAARPHRVPSPPILPQDAEVTDRSFWSASSTSEDMDIMVTLRNVGQDGKDLFEIGQHGQPVALTMGWLRASHRKLDPERSLPYRPYHAHDERSWLKPDEPVDCHVEIWPTSIVLNKGTRLRLDAHPLQV